MHNEKQHKEGRMREEGHHAKHMRSDGSVPITGNEAMKIHGKTTGEMAKGHTGMVTDAGKERMLHGKRGDHEEEK